MVKTEVLNLSMMVSDCSPSEQYWAQQAIESAFIRGEGFNRPREKTVLL